MYENCRHFREDLEQRPNEMSKAIPPEQFKITQLTYTADDVKEKFAIYFQQVATYYKSPPLLLAICEQKRVLNDNLEKNRIFYASERCTYCLRWPEMRGCLENIHSESY
jgi:hypothetical protein